MSWFRDIPDLQVEGFPYSCYAWIEMVSFKSYLLCSHRVVPEASLRFSLLVTGTYCYAQVAVSHTGSHSVGSKLALYDVLLFEMKGKMLLIENCSV